VDGAAFGPGGFMIIQINWVGEILDTIAKVLGKYGTWLGIRKNRMCFIVNIICCVYWIGIDVYRNLWSQALFTIPTIALQIYGFYKWGKDDKETERKTLANTNPYMKDPEQRDALIKRSVLTSTAVDKPNMDAFLRKNLI
jgi:nicotinamide riboside transporter PnuC